jgi:hypothetical protein
MICSLIGSTLKSVPLEDATNTIGFNGNLRESSGVSALKATLVNKYPREY